MRLLQIIYGTPSHIILLLAVWITTLVTPLSAESTVDGKAIRLTQIEGRHWLLMPDRQPFFAHGITHAGNNLAKFDYKEFSKACKKVGFNAYGYGCPEPLRKDMPFVESWNHLMPISYYRGTNGVRFLDIFDPKVQAKLENGVKASCFRSRNNPNVIGYCWTDLASWPLVNPSGKNWVNFIRNLSEGSPGRKAYQQFLSTRKDDEGQARDRAFLRLIAREYFRVVGGAQRKYAPGRLVFGERFGLSKLQRFNTMVPEVIEEMLPYVDGIAIQPPFHGAFPKAELDAIYEQTGKPILLCDFAVRFKDGDKDIRSWKPEKDSVAAGKAYADYVKAALQSKYVVGVFWCNPVDTPKNFGKLGVKQGFFGPNLSTRPGLHAAVQKINAQREAMTPKRQPK